MATQLEPAATVSSVSETQATRAAAAPAEEGPMTYGRTELYWFDDALYKVVEVEHRVFPDKRVRRYYRRSRSNLPDVEGQHWSRIPDRWRNIIRRLNELFEKTA